MTSELFIYRRENGEHQRVQAVTADNWEALEFFAPEPSASAFGQFCSIYRNYLVPACPWIFRNLILFCLPQPEAEPPATLKHLGSVCAPEIIAAETLRSGVTMQRGNPFFKNKEAAELWNRLESAGCLQVIRGKLPGMQVIPVAGRAGMLSESEPAAALKVNSAFFIMDCFDAATPYDLVGIPFGLEVRSGLVTRPPLYEREALTVRKDGTIAVTVPRLEELTVEINGKLLRHGENAAFFTRPRRKRTPSGGTDYVLIENRVTAVKPGGRTPIPASGFVLKTNEPLPAGPGDLVTFRGMEEIRFAIQAGSSVVRQGVPSKRFYSRFFNIRRPWQTPYPPSLYPLNYEKSRAARIALGADAEGRPMLVWAEGAAKFGHAPGQDSCGASLSELSEICASLGMVNGVNLDGGGSAQILLRGSRQLCVSDRVKETFAEAERSVPAGLIIR